MRTAPRPVLAAVAGLLATVLLTVGGTAAVGVTWLGSATTLSNRVVTTLTTPDNERALAGTALTEVAQNGSVVERLLISLDHSQLTTVATTVLGDVSVREAARATVRGAYDAVVQGRGITIAYQPLVTTLNRAVHARLAIAPSVRLGRSKRAHVDAAHLRWLRLVLSHLVLLALAATLGGLVLGGLSLGWCVRRRRALAAAALLAGPSLVVLTGGLLLGAARPVHTASATLSLLQRLLMEAFAHSFVVVGVAGLAASVLAAGLVRWRQRTS